LKKTSYNGVTIAAAVSSNWLIYYYIF
jgi:hypothetical protein